MSRKRYNLEKVGGEVKEIARELGMSGALDLHRLKALWDGLFPGPLAMHTEPAFFTEGALTVNVDSPGWLHQAEFIKSSMLEKLSQRGVKSIRFRIGRVTAAASAKPSHAYRGDALPQYDITETSGIKDPELRQSIERAIGMWSVRKSQMAR